MPRSVTRTLLRTSFELAGVVPLGVFLVVHLVHYAGASFGASSVSLGAPERWLPIALEAALVWLPLALHAGYGVALTFRALPATPSERSSAWLLRATGMIALAFLAAHLYWFRWPILSGARLPQDAILLVAERLSTPTRGVPLIAALHLAGLLAVAAHFTFGLAQFLERWGVARGPRAKNACTALGSLLFVFGAASIVELATGSAFSHFWR